MVRCLVAAGAFVLRTQLATAVVVIVLMLVSAGVVRRTGWIDARRTRVLDEGTPMAALDSVAEPAPSEEGNAFVDAVAAYQRGRYAQAAKSFDRSFDLGIRPAESLLFAARSHRAVGKLNEALSRFDRLVRKFNSSEHASQAALEGGECARILGNTGYARMMFERARSSPLTRHRADQLLRDLPKVAAAAPEPDPPTDEPSLDTE